MKARQAYCNLDMVKLLNIAHIHVIQKQFSEQKTIIHTSQLPYITCHYKQLLYIQYLDKWMDHLQFFSQQYFSHTEPKEEKE